MRSWFLVAVFIGLCRTDPVCAQKFPDGFFHADRVKQGELLSRAHCAACHLWPAPDILDRDTWLQGPLPWMMGIMGLTPEALPHGLEGDLIRRSGAVLTNAPLSTENFGKIIAYYLSASSTNSALQSNSASPLTLKQFVPRQLPYRSAEPMASLVMLNDSTATMFVGDGVASSLKLLGNDGKAIQEIALPSTPVAMAQTTNGWFVTCVGSFSPSEQPKGSVVFVPRQREATRFETPRPVLKNLTRPVHLALADLNQDGAEDFVVCMFGWYSGRLSWFENNGAGRYVEHILWAKPGALRTEVRDLNGDGHPDIAVLLAQAGEEMLFFYNDGHGQFTRKPIFQKHPAFGHSYFELADMNDDGKPDIVTANGDNGDYASPTKPYHGIRIYLNAGGDKFEERFFYPMPGAYKAMAKDFDRDGDLDLACISYYPDYRQRRHDGFVYLENRGGLKFEASTFKESTAGRWLTMDTGDFDKDGDVDIVLGAVRKGPGRDTYVPEELTEQWKASGATVMVLENVSASFSSEAK